MSERDEPAARNPPSESDGARPQSGFSVWLIHRAARHAPESLSQRLEEEWLADFAARTSAASRLRFALGCCWATRVIVHENVIAPIPVATSSVGARSLIASAHPGFGFLSRRTTAFGLVVLFHVAVFYAFMVGLSTRLTKVTESPLQPRLLQPDHARELPPLPPPDVRKIPYEVPPLDDQFTIPPDDTGPVMRAEEHKDGSPPPEVPTQPAQPHVVTQVQGGPGAGFPNPDDFYPPLARHLEEQGLAVVRVCVDLQGHLTSDPTTLETTGSARLDEGALKLARAGSGHYRASTEDGRPVNSCYPLRIRFQIKN